MRIALVLCEAGALSEAYWEDFVRASGLAGEKTLTQILKSDVSLNTFYELFTMDVFTLKSGAKKGGQSEIARALSSPVTVTSGEILEILRKNKPDVARLCHFLISRELMSTEALERALEFADKSAHNVYEVLVSHNLITPEIVATAVEDPRTEFGSDNRTLLAADILSFNNLITRDDLSRALESRAVTHAPLHATLADLGILNQDEIVLALHSGLELPTLDLSGYEISSELADRFPAEFLRRQLFVPLSVQDRFIEIGTADPFNLALSDTIALLTGRRVSTVYTPHQDLLARLAVLYPQASGGEEPLTSMPAVTAPRAMAPVRAAAPPVSTSNQQDSGARAADVTRKAAGEPFVDNLSTVQLVSQIIDAAISARATDIHIEPNLDAVRIRYRVDGRLHSVMRIPAEMLLSVTSRIKVLAGMNVTERRRPQDGHLSFETKTGGYDFRISTLPSAYGEKLVLRILDSSRVMTGLAEIGLADDQMEIVERLVTRPHGLILVTGPTGSGKTSTLYSCLSAVNRDEVNIITIEDPVEYMLPGITQVQVDSVVELDFASGLRTALRQDPDVIMVGEIRDAETAHTAVRAAMTGHLVFSTMHTNTAVGAISALCHMKVDHFAVSAGLAGIISQRLVRCLDQDSREQYKPTKAELKSLGLPESSRKKFWRGKPAEANMGTGYRGRTGIFEVAEITGEVRRAIGDGATDATITELLKLAGARTLLESGVEKILQGKTSVEEVLRAVVAEI